MNGRRGKPDKRGSTADRRARRAYLVGLFGSGRFAAITVAVAWWQIAGQMSEALI